MRKIAIYGKGGIGKSTTVSNLAAVMAEMGHRVMLVGCDPKADSTRLLLGGERIQTVLDSLEDKGDDLQAEDIIHEGFGGVLCVESGGPPPGLGCAGRGVAMALEKLEEMGVYEEHEIDVVFYDVLGDVVCGGFVMPIRNNFAEEVYVVTSAEMMALYAADNISRAINNFGSRGYAKLKGLIHNSRDIENEDELVARAASEMGTAIIGKLPRHKKIQEADQVKKTVVELFSDSDIRQAYGDLAEKILES